MHTIGHIIKSLETLSILNSAYSYCRYRWLPSHFSLFLAAKFRVRVSGFGVSREMNERDGRGNEGGKRELGYNVRSEPRK